MTHLLNPMKLKHALAPALVSVLTLNCLAQDAGVEFKGEAKAPESKLSLWYPQAGDSVDGSAPDRQWTAGRDGVRRRSA